MSNEMALTKEERDDLIENHKNLNQIVKQGKKDIEDKEKELSILKSLVDRKSEIYNLYDQIKIVNGVINFIRISDDRKPLREWGIGSCDMHYRSPDNNKRCSVRVDFSKKSLKKLKSQSDKDRYSYDSIKKESDIKSFYVYVTINDDDRPYPLTPKGEYDSIVILTEKHDYKDYKKVMKRIEGVVFDWMSFDLVPRETAETFTHLNLEYRE